MQLNLKPLIFLTLIAGLILTGCGAPAAATVAPAATQAATEPPAAALPVELWTYYGDTGPAAACVKTAAEDFNAAQSQYVLNIRNLAFTDFNQPTAVATGETPDLIIVDNR
jgi:ABC-type glycerol-3-phosphate transport system substrate-binding protein